MKPIETIYQEIIEICKDKLGIEVTKERLEYVFRFDDIYLYPIWEEECNCGDNPRCRNGGNYHRQIYVRSYDGILTIIDSDSSEEFLQDKSILIWIDREHKNYYCIDSDKADYQAWTDADFIINARRDKLVGFIFEYE